MTRLVLLLVVTAAGAARPEIQRRRFLAAAAASTTAPAPADASGLLLLPPTKPLTNRYVLVRAGESRSEADGVIETNAARKFLFSNGLTEEGAKQASAAADAITRVFGDASGPPVVRDATARIYCTEEQMRTVCPTSGAALVGGTSRSRCIEATLGEKDGGRSASSRSTGLLEGALMRTYTMVQSTLWPVTCWASSRWHHRAAMPSSRRSRATACTSRNSWI